MITEKSQMGELIKSVVVSSLYFVFSLYSGL